VIFLTESLNPLTKNCRSWRRFDLKMKRLGSKLLIGKAAAAVAPAFEGSLLRREQA